MTAAKVSPGLEGNLSLSMNESVDNQIARHFPQMGGEPLTLYTGPRNGYLEEVLSYRGEKQLRPAEDDPSDSLSTNASETDNSYSELGAQRRQSINDSVLEQNQRTSAKSLLLC